MGEGKFLVHLPFLVFCAHLFYHTNLLSLSRWMNSLLSEGNKKELEMEDIFEVRKQDESEVLGDRLEQ